VRKERPAAPAGVNAYIPLLAVALAERFGWLHLNRPYDVLGAWWVITIIAVLLLRRWRRRHRIADGRA
jgi:hypothetical protein